MEEMEGGAVDSVLYREGYGMLAMNDDVPYVVPMSFGYDGTACYVQMTTTGHKNDLLERHSRSTLAVVSRLPGSGVSESVLVSGAFERVTGDAVAEGLGALAANAEFGPDLAMWGDPVEDVDLGVYRLALESVSGRRFEPGDPF